MKKKYSRTFAFDIDGVLADFEGEFCDRFGYDNRHIDSLSARYPEVDPDLIDEFVNDPQTYERLIPIFGGLCLLNTAVMNNWYILLITSRPRHLMEITREWLEGMEIRYNDLWFAKNKSIAITDFNTMYPNRKVEILVDDFPSNLKNLPLGVSGVLWEQPWNSNETLTSGITRARYNEDTYAIEFDTVSMELGNG